MESPVDDFFSTPAGNPTSWRMTLRRRTGTLIAFTSIRWRRTKNCAKRMWADFLLRWYFYLLKGDRNRMKWAMYDHHTYLFEFWTGAIGCPESPEPDPHAELLGPEWFGNIDMAD